MEHCKVSLLLVLIILMVITFSECDEENKSDGRKRLGCVKPSGILGQIVRKDCSMMVCVRVGKVPKWEESFDSSSCCSYQRFGFKIGENISTTLQDGSAVTLMCVRKYDNSGDIIIKLDGGIASWINKTVNNLVDEKIQITINQQNSIWNKTMQENIAESMNKTSDLLLQKLKASENQQNSKWNKTMQENIAESMNKTSDLLHQQMKASENQQNSKWNETMQENIDESMNKTSDLLLQIMKASENQQSSKWNETMQENIAESMSMTSILLLEKLKASEKQQNLKWNETMQDNIAESMSKTSDLLLQKMKTSENQQNLKWKETIDKINAKVSSQMDQTGASLSTLNTKLSQTNQNLQNLPGKWSAGSYCILASGSCPAGFTKQSGHIRAISTYAATTQYIKPQRFGDSKITCHGTCGQYKGWYADIFIVTCCK